MGRRTGLNTGCTLLAALLWSTLCAANPSGDTLPEALRTCASIKRNSERLACYDRTIEQISSSAPDAAVAFKPSAEAMFGTKATEPRAESSASTAERQELAVMTARVSKLARDGEGMHVIELDNGQRWHQISGSKTLLLKEGDEVRISRGAMSSFLLSTQNGRAAKVKRIH